MLNNVKRVIRRTQAGVSSVERALGKLLGRPDFESELHYWSGYLWNHCDRISDPVFREPAFPKILNTCIEKMHSSGRVIKVLEVGSGPISNLAYGVEQGLFSLTAIDPLAKKYQRLLRDVGLSYPVKPRKGTGERLVKKFGRDAFDIAYCCNALDHMVSPRRCVSEMHEVVKKGGFILIEAFVREGTFEGWHGLHQHDLVPEENQLIHYDPNGVRTDLTGRLNLNCEYLEVQSCKERNRDARGQGMSVDMLEFDKGIFDDRAMFSMMFRKT